MNILEILKAPNIYLRKNLEIHRGKKKIKDQNQEEIQDITKIDQKKEALIKIILLLEKTLLNLQ
jgi:hypothetical protein